MKLPEILWQCPRFLTFVCCDRCTDMFFLLSLPLCFQPFPVVVVVVVVVVDDVVVCLYVSDV